MWFRVPAERLVRRGAGDAALPQDVLDHRIAVLARFERGTAEADVVAAIAGGLGRTALRAGAAVVAQRATGLPRSSRSRGNRPGMMYTPSAT